MNSYRYQYIESWTETDLLQLRSVESDLYEYKSSRIPDDNLGDEISKAASAFWNSGGGILIAGVDKKGKIDGGITGTVGRQDRRDWVDQHIKKTEPPGKYWVKLISASSSASAIKADCVVLAIGFEESPIAPHMAHDKKYYIRAGAHSDGASHFLVEAIRARRVIQTPVLRAVLRRSERKSRIVELAIMALNDTPALDVQISFDPPPKVLGEHFANSFPLSIPVIDRSHPFHMELYIWGAQSQTFGEQPSKVKVTCKDLLDRTLDYEQIIDITKNISPMTMGDTDLEKIEKSLKEVSQKVHYLNSIFEAFYESSFPPHPPKKKLKRPKTDNSSEA